MKLNKLKERAHYFFFGHPTITLVYMTLEITVDL